MDALINVVIPVFGIVLAGYLAGCLSVLGSESAVALNRFVYFFALPALLFAFTARAPLAKVLNWPFIAAFIGAGMLTLCIALIVGRIWFRLDFSTLSMHGLTSVYGNVTYMGVPLLLTAYGPDGVLPTIAATLAINFVFIAAGIAALEAARATGPSTPRVVSQVAGTLAVNPLLLSLLLGIVFSGLALPLPKAIGNFLDLMSAAAGPGALFALGLSLVDRKLMGGTVEAFWLVVLKLAIYPLLALILVTKVFALDPLWGQAVVVLSAMPIGAGAFIVAQQYNVHVPQVSAAIVLSTAISVFTISFLLIWLRAG
jgi:malonate transporter and related proteins